MGSRVPWVWYRWPRKQIIPKSSRLKLVITPASVGENLGAIVPWSWLGVPQRAAARLLGGRRGEAALPDGPLTWPRAGGLLPVPLAALSTVLSAEHVAMLSLSPRPPLWGTPGHPDCTWAEASLVPAPMGADQEEARQGCGGCRPWGWAASGVCAGGRGGQGAGAGGWAGAKSRWPGRAGVCPEREHPEGHAEAGAARAAGPHEARVLSSAWGGGGGLNSEASGSGEDGRLMAALRRASRPPRGLSA